MRRFVLFVIMLGIIFPVYVVMAQDEPISPSIIGTGVYYGLTPPLKDLPTISKEEWIEMQMKAEVEGVERNEELQYRSYPYADIAYPKGPDEAWQKQMGETQTTKAPILNFSGQTSPYYPPDCNGAVGPSHFMQTINTVYAIYNNTTGALVAGPTNMNQLFSGVTGATCNDGDPLVLYDEQANRWLAVEFSICGSNDYMLVAVSQTSDPTGSWHKYSFDVADMPDYEKFGIWQDGYYMGTNNSSGNDIYVFQRSQMLNGLAAQFVGFNNAWRPTTIDGFMCVPPVDNDGAFAPSGSPGLFITINDDAIGGGSDQLWIYELAVNWSLPSSSTFNRVQQISVASFDSNFGNNWDNIKQLNTTRELDAIPMVIMNIPQYRNFGSYQTIVCCHTVDVDATDHAGIRWYELRKTTGTWAVRQYGTYAPDAHSRWMGSIALNGSNELGLGYSISSSTMYPGIRYCGQSAATYNSASGLSSLDIAESVIQNGTNSQTAYNRWGDYSAISIDPDDDHTFWFTTQYGGSRQTKIASFQFSSGVTPPVADFSASNTAPFVGATVNFTDLSTNSPTSWFWVFTPSNVTYVGGTTSASQNPQVQFNAAGLYTVALTATNAGGPNTMTKTNYINAQPVILPPVANFSASTITPFVGATVNFTDLSTNVPTSWIWVFTPSTVTYIGGTTSASQNPQVQFNTTGLYTVALTATNASGSNTMTKTNFINALPVPPVADFVASTTIPFVGATVYFTDLSTHSPTSWLWAFTPSTVTYVGGTTSASQNPQVQFNVAGFYTVSLTATNASGPNTMTKTNYINAQGAPPVATLKLGTLTNPAPGTVLVPVTLEAINNPILGNNLISSWGWFIAYDATRLYNAAPMSPANLTNYNSQFPSTSYVTNIIENNPSPGWNTIAVVYATAVSGSASVGMKFFDIVFTYTPGTTDCSNLFWTSTADESKGNGSKILETVMADDEGNEFFLTLIDGCVWSEPPVTDFMASTTTPFVGETVNFIDLSINYPTSWLWSFTPSTVTYVGGTSSTSQNPQLQFDGEGTYTVSLTSTNALGSDIATKTDYIVVQNAIIDLDITVYLEGPFNGTMMTQGLTGLVPLNQPYNTAPWNYTGTESVASVPANSIDWVLIELRDATSAGTATSGTRIARKAAFLRNDGRVIGLTGTPVLNFGPLTITNSLFVIVHHRNHISVLSASGLTQTGGIYTYNFSTGSAQAYGGTNAHKQIGPGVWGMFGGNGDGSGVIDSNDEDPAWESQAGTKGYLRSDYNFDTHSNNKDKDDIWSPNLGKGNQVPN